MKKYVIDLDDKSHRTLINIKKENHLDKAVVKMKTKKIDVDERNLQAVQLLGCVTLFHLCMKYAFR